MTLGKGPKQAGIKSKISWRLIWSRFPWQDRCSVQRHILGGSDKWLTIGTFQHRSLYLSGVSTLISSVCSSSKAITLVKGSVDKNLTRIRMWKNNIGISRQNHVIVSYTRHRDPVYTGLKKIEAVSGAKIKLEKSAGLQVSTWKGRFMPSNNIVGSWTEGSIKLLVVWFDLNFQVEKNWDEVDNLIQKRAKRKPFLERSGRGNGYLHSCCYILYISPNSHALFHLSNTTEQCPGIACLWVSVEHLLSLEGRIRLSKSIVKIVRLPSLGREGQITFPCLVTLAKEVVW